MAGFGQEAVIFRAAFSGARFTPAWAMRVGITGDGQQHFLNKCGDCSGLVFGPACRIGELAHGVQAAFERKAIEVDVVDEGGFLHDAADEVVGDEMHEQFAFDHERVHAAGEQGGEGAEGAKPPVGDKQIALIQSAPEVLEKLAFVRVPVPVSGFDERPGEQAKNADEGHRGKAAARLLALALRPAGLVGRSVGHRDACAVGEPDVAAMPERAVGDMALHARDEMGVDLVHHLDGDFRASLAIGRGFGTHWKPLLAGKSSAREGHDLADRLAAGPVGRLNLIEKAPENDIEGKEAAAAVVAGGSGGEQRLGDVGAESLAKLGKGAALRKLGESLREGRDRRLAKKQGTEGAEEGS